jgi:alpha-aminoadipic semialdehyde synthase
VNKIGLRKEEKPFETRVAIVPEHATILNKEHGIKFIVEPSDQRFFSPDDYSTADVEISSLKGSSAKVILGIKEIPIEYYEPGKVYIFFSHTIKCQDYNMKMLKHIIETGSTLIDYEKVIDEKGRRLIYFGNWAGLAGMSDTLRSLGDRLEYEGISPNPFADMKPTMETKSLSNLKDEFRKLGKRIEEEGLPDALTPFVVGFAGYGNVSRGAQELFDILPHKTIEPSELSTLSPDDKTIYKCVFKEEHMVAPIDPSSDFDLQDYYDNGNAKYKGDFHKYVPYLSVLMNCIYWSENYPELITKDFIRNHWKDEKRNLRIVGDISCDVEGAIEFTLKCTKPDRPAFTYLVEEDRAELGVAGNGPVVMSVDNLPCELPRESSTSFSDTLRNYIPVLAKANFDVPFQELDLPRELLDAVIVYQGKLTKNYEYLKDCLPN